MSNFAIEKLLWQATNNPGDAVLFRAEPDRYLAGFRIDDAERAMLLEWDIAGLADHGVNPMVLMMAYNAVVGTGDIMDYINKINRPR